MSSHVYKVSEVVGSSPDGLEAAVQNAIATTAKTVRNMDWFEVTEIRGHLADDAIAHWQVAVKVGFRIEE